MAIYIRRREFIFTLGSAAAAWPHAARAQQPERMRRIGVLQGGSDREDDALSRPNVTAFLQALQQLGWVDGRNIKVDYRWPAGGDPAQARRYAAELVALAPDVIVAVTSASIAPLLQATRTVPLVFVGVVDPVGAGYVDSLSRPGGNATGFVMFDYCACRKSNTHIHMMKSAKKWRRHNATHGVYCSRHRGILVDRKMRASRVIVGSVRLQQMAKMPLAEHDNMVKTFPPDRTDRCVYRKPKSGRSGDEVRQGSDLR